MALKLYRRHRKECEGGHAEDSCSGEFEEGRRVWRRCRCVIHAAGTLAGQFKRRQTGKTDWDEAKAVVDEWEKAGAWDGAAKAAPPIDGSTQLTAARMAILEATDSYFTNRKNRGIEPSTLSKYQTFVNQFRAYCDSRGYVFLDQLAVEDMDRFYGSWRAGKRSRAKKLETLKSFVRFCLKRKWLSEDIADDLEPPAGSSVPANKTPFTDQELERIYAACDALGGPTPPGAGHREWTGEDAKDFIMLSIYTGLRISDVSTFNTTERLNGNDVFLRMHKTKKELYTWIPDWLVSRVRAREGKHGALIFGVAESRVTRSMAELWRVKLQKVFRIAGPFEERPTPHRFRHTFVRILLEKGVPVGDVAELIGDTEDVVRRHYSRWVPERQARLSKILREAFEGKLRPRSGSDSSVDGR